MRERWPIVSLIRHWKNFGFYAESGSCHRVWNKRVVWSHSYFRILLASLLRIDSVCMWAQEQGQKKRPFRRLIQWIQVEDYGILEQSRRKWHQNLCSLFFFFHFCRTRVVSLFLNIAVNTFWKHCIHLSSLAYKLDFLYLNVIPPKLHYKTLNYFLTFTFLNQIYKSSQLKNKFPCACLFICFPNHLSPVLSMAM